MNEWYWRDNGFSTLEAQEQAHRPLLDLIPQVAQGGNILDLGCGNGALLKKLRERNPDFIPYGVDVNPVAIQNAKQLLPEFANHFVVGDMFEYRLPRSIDVVLLMPGRLVEVPIYRAFLLLNCLRHSGATVIAYAYGDWVTRYGSLAGLCREAGLRLRDAPVVGPISQAGVVEL
ncbi:MAG: methyltransferase domain-containing protein [Limnochordales bacterium]|nr:methyltransferase domain-containing protein [Limnochordales bacterium]